jgi:hypothetical protein
MYSCAAIYSSKAGARLLLTFIRRSLFLDLRYEGGPEEATEWLAQSAVDILFVHLPPPQEPVNARLLTQWQQHRALIVIASYPWQAYNHWQLTPQAFLLEPFTVDAFSYTLQVIMNQIVTKK